MSLGLNLRAGDKYFSSPSPGAHVRPALEMLIFFTPNFSLSNFGSSAAVHQLGAGNSNFLLLLLRRWPREEKGSWMKGRRNTEGAWERESVDLKDGLAAVLGVGRSLRPPWTNRGLSSSSSLCPTIYILYILFFFMFSILPTAPWTNCGLSSLLVSNNLFLGSTPNTTENTFYTQPPPLPSESQLRKRQQNSLFFSS